MLFSKMIGAECNKQGERKYWEQVKKQGTEADKTDIGRKYTQAGSLLIPASTFPPAYFQIISPVEYAKRKDQRKGQYLFYRLTKKNRQP